MGNTFKAHPLEVTVIMPAVEIKLVPPLLVMAFFIKALIDNALAQETAHAEIEDLADIVPVHDNRPFLRLMTFAPPPVDHVSPR